MVYFNRPVTMLCHLSYIALVSCILECSSYALQIHRETSQTLSLARSHDRCTCTKGPCLHLHPQLQHGPSNSPDHRMEMAMDALSDVPPTTVDRCLRNERQYHISVSHGPVEVRIFATSGLQRWPAHGCLNDPHTL